VGNEIPASIVRWHGRQRIERFIARLYRIVKAEDAGALVTYVNFPTTEYLSLPFLDILCFNVYLETREKLESYLARLQNLAGDRPLLMAEIGLDSRRKDSTKQAEVPIGRYAPIRRRAQRLRVHGPTRVRRPISRLDFTTRDGSRSRHCCDDRAFARVPFPPTRNGPRQRRRLATTAANDSRHAGGLNASSPDWGDRVNDGSTDATAHRGGV
jgi:hypothetical protein